MLIDSTIGARVAEIMGPTFSEGSIVQHLSKLRNLMAEAGIPVPPAVKRGTITKSPSKIYGAAANPRVKLEPVASLFPDGTSFPKIKQEGDEEEQLKSIYDRPKRASNKAAAGEDTGKETGDKTNVEEKTPEKITSKKEPVKAKGTAKGKSKGRRNNMSDDDDDEPVPDLYDSDEDYGAPKKKRRTSAKPKKQTIATKAPAEAPPVDSEEIALPVAEPVDDLNAEGEVTVKVEDADEETGPATRTRGIKRDYSMMAAPSSDETEPEFAEQERVDQVAEASVGYAVEEGTHDDTAEDEYEHTDIVDLDDDDDGAACSEASTQILGPEDAAEAEFNAGYSSQPAHVADMPYGQLMADPRVMASQPTN